MMGLLLVLQETTLDPTVNTGTGIDRAQWVSMLNGVVIPILVALVTKHSDKPRTKALLLLGLSTVSGFLTELLIGADNFVWQQALFGTVTTFVVGVATLFGLWNPTGVDAAAKNTLRHD